MALVAIGKPDLNIVFELALVILDSQNGVCFFIPDGLRNAVLTIPLRQSSRYIPTLTRRSHSGIAQGNRSKIHRHNIQAI